MEKLPSFVLKLSLEEMALRRVVINLWYESDILSAIQNFLWKEFVSAFSSLRDQKDNLEWRKTIERKVKGNISRLMLPASLKKRMMHLVRPVGYQILRWKICHKELDADSLQQLCWTSAGKVDDEKTVERLVCLEIFHVEKRYELACSYCLKDYLPLLWNQLPEDSKRRFYVQLSDSLNRNKLLQAYWAYVLKGEESKFQFLAATRLGESFFFYAFQLSALSGCKSATEYFFQKLSNEERVSSLLRAFRDIITENMFGNPYKREKDYEVLCYLLSQMSSQQQLEVLKKYPCDVLGRLLYWPWQDLFLDYADLIWPFLLEKDYSNLIFNICANSRHAQYYFPYLIQKCFLLIPKEFRKGFFINFFTFFEPIFSEISDNEDTETIKVLFRNIEPEHRGCLVLQEHFLLFLHHLIMEEKWQFVELCIQEASVSKEEKAKMKEKLLRKIPSGSHRDELPFRLEFFLSNSTLTKQVKPN